MSYTSGGQGLGFMTLATENPCGPAADNIRETQRLLMKLGYDVGASGADGQFGQKTAAAFANYCAGLASKGQVCSCDTLRRDASGGGSVPPGTAPKQTSTGACPEGYIPVFNQCFPDPVKTAQGAVQPFLPGGGQAPSGGGQAPSGGAGYLGAQVGPGGAYYPGYPPTATQQKGGLTTQAKVAIGVGGGVLALAVIGGIIYATRPKKA